MCFGGVGWTSKAEEQARRALRSVRYGEAQGGVCDAQAARGVTISRRRERQRQGFWETTKSLGRVEEILKFLFRQCQTSSAERLLNTAIPLQALRLNFPAHRGFVDGNLGEPHQIRLVRFRHLERQNSVGQNRPLFRPARVFHLGKERP